MSYRISKNGCSNTIDGTISSDEHELDVNYSKERTSWLESISSFFTTSPSDWHIILNERIETIDWDAKAKTLAQPAGNLLTFVFYVVRLLQDNLIKPNLHKISSKQDAFDLSKSERLKSYEYFNQYANNFEKQPHSANALYLSFLNRLSRIFYFTIILLLLWNICSSYRFFGGCYKTYSLFYLKERPQSKNITKQSLTGLNDDYIENLSNRSIWSMLRLLIAGKNTVDQHVDEDAYYYRLKKWVPSKFSTHFFVSFSPTCIIFLLLSEVSFSTLFAVLIHQFMLSFIILDRFENRIIDDAIIAKATMAEFDVKFVIPRVSKKMQGVQIDATPYGNGFVKFLPAITSTKSDMFKTHSLNGELITEKYNPATQEFEDVQDESEPHNLIMQPPQFNPILLYHDPADCRRYDLFRDDIYRRYHRGGEVSPTRMSSPSGFYPPVVSTPSGISTPYVRSEQSPTYMNSYSTGQASHQISGPFGNEYQRKKSRSPLRKSVLSSRNTDDAAHFRLGSISGQSVSSRSSSKSPNRRNDLK